MTPMTHLMTDNDDDDVYLARCSIRILTVSVLPAPDSPLTSTDWFCFCMCISMKARALVA